MTSFNTNYENFIKENDFRQFIRKDVRAAESETSEYSFSIIKAKNIIDKWCKHVESWMRYKDRGVTFVSFGDLKYDLGSTLRMIEARSSQRLKRWIQAVTVEDQRYRPDFRVPGLKRGEVGIWKEYFQPEDVSFLESIVPAGIRQLSYARDYKLRVPATGVE
jgi:hypothetical protein